MNMKTDSVKVLEKSFSEIMIDVEIEQDLNETLLKEIPYPLSRKNFEYLCEKYNIDIKTDKCCKAYMKERIKMKICNEKEISEKINRYNFIPEYLYDIRGYSLKYFKLHDYSKKGDNFISAQIQERIKTKEESIYCDSVKNNTAFHQGKVLTFPLSRKDYEDYCIKLNTHPKSDLFCLSLQKRDMTFITKKTFNLKIRKKNQDFLFYLKLIHILRGISYGYEKNKINFIQKILIKFF